MLPPVWPLVQLLVEIVALIVEVQDMGVMNEEGEGATHQQQVVANYDVQKFTVVTREGHEEIFHGFG